MINNIFEFDNKTISDIMTHRTNIVALSVDTSLKDTVAIVNREKYTRMPVYEGSIDHIIGILHTKDLIPFIECGDQEVFDLRSMLREPSFVLESMHLDQLFKVMQQSNLHMAVAIDEYGGTDGIVTIEDLIEEIVGNIFDEHDEPELDAAEIVQVDTNQYVMDGTLNLYEVEDALKIELPSEEYDTLSGFVLGQLGYIPAADEHPEVEYQDIVFAVAEMDDRRIARVNIRIKDSAAATE
ncbi:MAG: hemolysin family protein [Mesobacillus sp.]